MKIPTWILKIMYRLIRKPKKILYVGRGGNNKNDGLTWNTRKENLAGIEEEKDLFNCVIHTR